MNDDSPFNSQFSLTIVCGFCVISSARARYVTIAEFVSDKIKSTVARDVEVGGFRCSMSHSAGEITRPIHRKNREKSSQTRRESSWAKTVRGGGKRRRDWASKMLPWFPRAAAGFSKVESLPRAARGLLNAILDFCRHYVPPADTRPRNDEGNLKLVMPGPPYARFLFIPNGPARSRSPFGEVQFVSDLSGISVCIKLSHDFCEHIYY